MVSQEAEWNLADGPVDRFDDIGTLLQLGSDLVVRCILTLCHCQRISLLEKQRLAQILENDSMCQSYHQSLVR